MPYSEVHQMAKGNLDSTKLKMKNCPGDLAFRSDQEFVELLWKNGQIVMQGHSSTMRKSSSSPGLVQEKDGSNAVSPKTRRYGLMESDVSGISATGPSGRVGIAHDDDLVPWLNYPVDDALQNDYCLEFFTELSGPSLKLLSSQHPSVPDEKNGCSSQVVRDPIQAPAHGRVNLEPGNASKAVRIRNGPLFLQSQQCRTSVPNPMLGDSAFVPNNNNKTRQSHFMNLTRRPALAAGMPISKMLKKDPLPIRPSQPSNNIGLMNFSHFSRPAALVKANLQNIGSVAVGTSGTDKFRGSHKVFLTNSDSIEPSVVESTRGLQSTAKGQPVSVLAKADLKPPSRTPQEMTSTEKSEAVCQEDVSRNNISLDHIHQSSSFAASVALGRPESQKALDPAVASSSACSGNSTGVLLNGTKPGVKRKGQEVEESWYQSEDAEDESMDAKKPNKCPKRSRAAEVHNLSERRRRDRINEKMRALQELIPNCNKVDKASMLDEAIEYLKTLQLQLQIMSMGTGFCMPPMMLPAGIQNVRTSPMLHFPPLGVGMRMGMGMGLGMGFGMGMPDIGCLSGYPSLPIAPMHGPHFSSVSASMSLHDLPGPNLQMFGIQGQGLPLSSPHAPFVPSSGFATKLPPVPDLSVAACPMPVPDSALPSSSKDQNQDVALQPMHKTVADCPENQPSTQVTRERLEQSDLVQGKYEISHIGGNEAINTTGINGIASGGTTGFD